MKEIGGDQILNHRSTRTCFLTSPIRKSINKCFWCNYTRKHHLPCPKITNSSQHRCLNCMTIHWDMVQSLLRYRKLCVASISFITIKASFLQVHLKFGHTHSTKFCCKLKKKPKLPCIVLTTTYLQKHFQVCLNKILRLFSSVYSYATRMSKHLIRDSQKNRHCTCILKIKSLMMRVVELKPILRQKINIQFSSF